jgi:hypothetical protein
MKIFVCWSGDRSYKLASFLDTWLETVLPGLDVFVSSEIEKGIRWSDEIKRALGESRAGLVCLAWESCQSAWINYEAGALANHVSTEPERLYPYLLDIEPSDVPKPLQQFNVTRSSKEETKKMVRSLANLQGDGGSWIATFEKNWQELEDKLSKLKCLPIELAVPGLFKLFDRNTFTERFPNNPRTWLDRYFAARLTYSRIDEAYPIVGAHCSDEIKESYGEILNYTKEYAKFAIPNLCDAQTKRSVAIALREVEDRRRLISESVKKLKLLVGSSRSLSE